MKTLLVIDTHAAVSDFLPDMWPYYARAEVDILGVERTNAPTRWPQGICCKGQWETHIPVISVGEDLGKRWIEHQHPTLLPQRMLDTIDRLLTHPQFEQYTDFCLSTWSVCFTGPLPQIPAPLVLTLAGGEQYSRGFTSPYLFHHPRWMNREMGARILEVGRILIDANRTERGADDFFLGLIVQEGFLPWFNAPGWTANSLETEKQVTDARKAIRDGAWWVGNVKNKDQLQRLMVR